MKIINGKKFYEREIKAAQRIDNHGWDRYDGRNWQQYWLEYNPECGLVILTGNNSGDCYGDYSTRYFDSPAAFREWCDERMRSWEKLLGDIDEDNAAAMAFAGAMLGA